MQLLVKCDTKTKDNVFVSIDVAVQYQAMEAKVYDAFYKLTDPHQQIKAYVFDGTLPSLIFTINPPRSVVRASVPKITLDQVFETKEEIAHAVKEELEKVRNEESKPEFLTIRTGYGRIWLRHHSNSYYRHYPRCKCQKGLPFEIISRLY